jgi:uncharacterized protein YecE (DUF72 family)
MACYNAGMIRTGTCSWTEKTLIQSGEFYPPAAKTAEARLRYYATHFDTVEVDSTYYAIPDAKTSWLWDMRTPADFTFHIKAYGALTGHGVDLRTLPKDVQSLVSHRPGEGKYTYVKEPSLLQMLAQRLIDVLSPLTKSGKLGLVIFQFPPWFTHKSSNLDYILFCRDMMNDMPIAVEFRHGSWFTSGTAQRTFDFLGEHNITYVAADEPQYGNLSTAPFIPQVTTDTAYFRFHGRNTENWLKKGVETALRYAYTYSEDELAAFVNHLSETDKKATTTYAMFNNCYRDYAVANAARLRQFLQKS